MAIQKTEAIVLKTQPLRSSSLIVTCFTPGFGKLKGIAKGVRREREVRGAMFELFTHLEIIFYEKLRSDLHLISEAAILESHDTLRTQLDTIVYASYFSELIDHLSEVHDPHPGIFELLDFALRFLSSVSPQKIARLFEVKLLQEIGWIPFLGGCLNCRDETLQQGYFSIHQGALYCQRCAPRFPDVKPMGPDVLSVMRYFINHSLELSMKLKVPEPVLGAIDNLVDRFLLYRLGFPLNSRRFLDKIRPVLASR